MPIIMKFHVKDLYDIQDLAKTDYDPKFKMAVMPISSKTIQTTSSPEPLGLFGWYFTGSIWGIFLYIIAKIVPVRS